MKIEKLEDLLTINTKTLKSTEKERLLTRVKQLIKSENKTEAKADENAKDLPYEAVSVVGGTFVELKFDLKTKQARVVNTHQDSRDINGQNIMSGARAVVKMQSIVKLQKEIEND